MVEEAWGHASPCFRGCYCSPRRICIHSCKLVPCPPDLWVVFMFFVVVVYPNFASFETTFHSFVLLFWLFMLLLLFLLFLLLMFFVVVLFVVFPELSPTASLTPTLLSMEGQEHARWAQCVIQLLLLLLLLLWLPLKTSQRTCSFAAAEGFSFCDLFRPFYRYVYIYVVIVVILMMVMVLMILMRWMMVLVMMVIYVQGRPLVWLGPMQYVLRTWQRHIHL